jgi:TetR/AcrR family transcriptional regulator, transcriptional repressor for nem operon
MTHAIYSGAMGRVTQAKAQENRQRVVETAARLFRERGVPGVSVADLMAEAGLTHGGFYKQFDSKDALVAEAVARAFEQSAAVARTFDSAAGFVQWYLSADHRDHPGEGCPAAGLAADVAREPAGSDSRAPYAAGIEQYAHQLAGDGGEDLAAVSMLVGALILARATAGTELSDRILAAASADLTGRVATPPAAD